MESSHRLKPETWNLWGLSKEEDPSSRSTRSQAKRTRSRQGDKRSMSDNGANAEDTVVKPASKRRSATEPGPIAGTTDIYRVAEIIDSFRDKSKKMFFRIRWQGYKETTWEPEEHIEDRSLLATYYFKNPRRTGNNRDNPRHPDFQRPEGWSAIDTAGK
ncbi:MAG: hypothetical protein M1820_009075 [Bogoriella megaspora]|nr:MAG: hypothetical protein M1820_009075 [Bogoriella megaspora]